MAAVLNQDADGDLRIVCRRKSDEQRMIAKALGDALSERALSDDNPSLTKASWGPIEQVEAIDDLTVRFNLAEPFSAFVPFMADEFTSMLCLGNEAAGDAFGTSVAIGTGPWPILAITSPMSRAPSGTPNRKPWI